MSGKECTVFMRSLAETPDSEAKFFGARMNRMADDEVYSYDDANIANIANIANKAMGIADAQFVNAKTNSTVIKSA